MIIGFICDYYRSGTTIFQRFVELCEPNLIVLSEPTQHEIVRHIIAYGWERDHPLHGYSIFKGYSKLLDKTLVEFIKRHSEVFDNDTSNHGLMTSVSDALYLLNPLHDCELPIVVKSTQLSIIIDRVVKHYDAWVIYLYRDTEKTIMSHFPNRETYEEFKRGEANHVSFYATLVYDRLKELGLVKDNPKSLYDMLKMNIETCNRIAIDRLSNYPKATIIDFDDFVLNPDKYVDKLPFNARIDIAKKLFDPKKLYIP